MAHGVNDFWWANALKEPKRSYRFTLNFPYYVPQGSETDAFQLAEKIHFAESPGNPGSPAQGTGVQEEMHALHAGVNTPGGSAAGQSIPGIGNQSAQGSALGGPAHISAVGSQPKNTAAQALIESINNQNAKNSGLDIALSEMSLNRRAVAAQNLAFRQDEYFVKSIEKSGYTETLDELTDFGFKRPTGDLKSATWNPITIKFIATLQSDMEWYFTFLTYLRGDELEMKSFKAGLMGADTNSGIMLREGDWRTNIKNGWRKVDRLIVNEYAGGMYIKRGLKEYNVNPPGSSRPRRDAYEPFEHVLIGRYIIHEPQVMSWNVSPLAYDNEGFVEVTLQLKPLRLSYEGASRRWNTSSTKGTYMDYGKRHAIVDIRKYLAEDVTFPETITEEYIDEEGRRRNPGAPAVGVLHADEMQRFGHLRDSQEELGIQPKRPTPPTRDELMEEALGLLMKERGLTDESMDQAHRDAEWRKNYAEGEEDFENTGMDEFESQNAARAEDRETSQRMSDDWAASEAESDAALRRLDGENQLNAISEEPMDDMRGLEGRTPDPVGEDDWSNEGQNEFQQRSQDYADDRAIGDAMSEDYADNDVDWTDERREQSERQDRSDRERRTGDLLNEWEDPHVAGEPGTREVSSRNLGVTDEGESIQDITEEVTTSEL